MEILTRISDEYSNMTKGKKKIARYILDNKEESAFYSAAELAENAGVSDSAVVRFAADLGFAGYKDMQSEFQEVLRNKLSVVGRFQHNLEIGKNKEYSWAVENTIKNINETLNEITPELIEEVKDAILGARNIGVAGIRGAIAPALVLQMFLNEILDNAVLLTPGMADSFDKVKSWDENDLIIGNAFFFTKNYTWEIMKYAKSKGCKTIAFTDSVATSIGRLADIVVPVKADGMFPSYTACMLVIETILSYVSRESDYKERIGETDIIVNKWLKRDDGDR